MTVEVLVTQESGRHLALRPGDNVFVSIDGDLSMEFHSSAMRKLQNLGLVPYVFQGVPAPRDGIVTNIYIEARNDLYQCRVLVVVGASASAERNFGLAELPRAVSTGLVGFLYRVGTPAGLDPEIRGVTARTVATVDEFEDALERDLRALLTPR